MNENDPLDPILREWEAPEPSPALDARIRAAYRDGRHPSPWQRFWWMRVSIPVPVLAAALLLIAAGLWLFRWQPAARPMPPARSGGSYLTRLETAGFQPLPDGATRVIRSGDRKR
jgi:hypothetical protein